VAVEHPDELRAGGSRCPDAEELAAYLEGTLAAASREAIETHLSDCARCRAALAETMTFMSDEAVPSAAGPGAVPSAARVLPFRRNFWRAGAIAALAAAAALLLVARVAPQMLPWGGPAGERPELEELIAAVAKEPTRPVEGRLTGGFAYGPPPPVMRGGASQEVSPGVRIAAANIQNRAGDDAHSREAAGLASLVSGNVDAAIASLEAAAAKDAGDAAIEANLAAAYLARAETSGGREDLQKALDAADRALRRDASLPGALFNRALALDRLGNSRAPAAWQAVLQAESDPAWRDEVSRRLRR
jgi:tetratricopeptide (TPR) repeat protein